MRNGKLCFCMFNFMNVYCYIKYIFHTHVYYLCRFERKRIGDKYIYSLVGFCTMYNYYFYNREECVNNNIDRTNNKVPVSERVNEGKVIPEDIRLRIR